MTLDLMQKLERQEWSAAVVGLGYVGLPLVVTVARAGIDVVGFDVNPAVTDALSQGRSHIDDVSDADLAEVAARTRFSSDAAVLREADVIFICVPTPLGVGKQPDVSYIEKASGTIAGQLRPGQLVILESTTYPGTTDGLVRGLLEQDTGLKLDEDFLLAYSPERVDPGNEKFGTANIPRVVGGATERSGEAAALVYSRFVSSVHRVSHSRVAEMAKLLENTFRWVNIGLVNEMAFVARAIGVDIHEVIDAAATKPFGFMPFYPGPGVGGHCIPLDPFYLQWAARVTGEGTRFVELAETINSRMPHIVVQRVQDALNEHAKPLNGSKVLVLGVAYKPNVRDYRESPAMEVMRLLERGGAVLSYCDPHVPEITHEGPHLTATPLTPEVLQGCDAALILTDHDAVDYRHVVEHAPLVVDTRNALARRGIDSEKIRKL